MKIEITLSLCSGIEWLMGLSVGWTDFAPLATPSCLAQRNPYGK